jgi:hypothetical protein
VSLADGKLLTLDLGVTVWGVRIQITGTIEALDVRREI